VIFISFLERRGPRCRVTQPFGQQRLLVFGEPAGTARIMADYNSLLAEIDAIWKSGQVQSHLLPTPEGCVETDIAKVKENRGYVQLRIRKSKFYVHILAALYRAKRPILQGEEASHLCNNDKCVNPDHLVLEDGLVNKSRLCCKLFGQKQGYLCPHQPTCPGCNSLQ
jgi:hypothetical protein